ncbi:MAG: NADH-quinone oxidoreductase subunit NuoK [Oligoflexia bacterium]|nr:NADH-quinone oxidoreductase subunit NuoK [Oligoflexia bacterium]
MNAFFQIQLLSAFLFFVGLLVVLLKRNIIIVLMGIELMLNAINLSFVVFSKQNYQIEGQLGVLFIIVIAAAESAIGLSILINFYRNFGVTKTSVANTLKG